MLFVLLLFCFCCFCHWCNRVCCFAGRALCAGVCSRVCMCACVYVQLRKSRWAGSSRAAELELRYELRRYDVAEKKKSEADKKSGVLEGDQAYVMRLLSNQLAQYYQHQREV